MKLIVGTYRKRAYIEQAIVSIDQFVTGWTDIVFVDDSGDAEHHQWLSRFGRVIDTGKQGYNTAMRAVCEAAAGEPFMFWEEDFTALQPINLDEMHEHLARKPHLAQVALLRGPWFPIEHIHGGLIEALEVKGEKFEHIDGLIEHKATFTCNPAVWSGEVAAAGWPAGRWSEDRKRDLLLNDGYSFAYMPGIRVAHNGERSGFGY